MKKTIVTIVGARPQFIKCAPVSRVLRKHFIEVLIHTGQHYDDNMSKKFFRELNIPEPKKNLEIGSASHALQTGNMLIALEKEIAKHDPAAVIVYGDTNSTLAGALVAAKMNLPVAHVEAGLRSFNRRMPEEINRIVADKLSALLFCPTPVAVKNLKNEGIEKGVYHVGDVMYDAILQNIQTAERYSGVLEKLNLRKENYYLATIHRAENTDRLENLQSIFTGLNHLDKTVVLPVHPRTRKIIENNVKKIEIGSNIKIIDPTSYLVTIVLQKHSCKILTDSGGMQKEAYFLQRPCITLRNETEWMETIEMGVNILVGTSPEKIVDAASNFFPSFPESEIFGDGNASGKIVEKIKQFLSDDKL